MLMVKLEARAVERENLIADLESRNTELEEIRQGLSRRNVFLQETLAHTFVQKPILGHCPAMNQVIERALHVAHYHINTMILGPTGSGKDVLAKTIFLNSPRREAEFVAVNCSAIPETLFESEMFGIEKGVATGVERRKGLIEAASGGILFLDEVAELALQNQAKLLRVLEEKQVRRVGARKSFPVDLQVISATNLDIKEAVASKSFREDLYYRLNVVELVVPPLRERGDDIMLLAKFFLKFHAARMGRKELRIGREAEKVIDSYPWPGNVRELQNEMERVAAMAEGPELQISDISDRIMLSVSSREESSAIADKRSLSSSEVSSSSNGHVPAQSAESDLGSEKANQRVSSLKELSRAEVIKALERQGGNKTRAAIELGLSREGLRKKLKKMGIN
jgi:DNA-binding NtrC family response regulator